MTLLSQARPDAVRAATAALAALADGLDKAHGDLDATAKALTGAHWHGSAAGEFGGNWFENGRALVAEAGALRGVAAALNQLTAELHDAQNTMQGLVDRAAIAGITLNDDGTTRLPPTTGPTDPGIAAEADDVARFAALALSNAAFADQQAANAINALISPTDVVAVIGSLSQNVGLGTDTYGGIAGGATAFRRGIVRGTELRVVAEAARMREANAVKLGGGNMAQRAAAARAETQARIAKDAAVEQARALRQGPKGQFFRIAELNVLGEDAAAAAPKALRVLGKVPVLQAVSAGLTFSADLAAGDSVGRAATRTAISTTASVAAGIAAESVVTSLAIGLGLAATGPVGLLVAGVAIAGGVYGGYKAQQVGDKVGELVYDNAVAPVGDAVAEVGHEVGDAGKAVAGAAKGAWHHVFG